MLDSSQLQCRWALRSDDHVLPSVSFSQLETLAKSGLYNFRYCVFVGLMAKHFSEYVRFIFIVVELPDWTAALSSWFCNALNGFAVFCKMTAPCQT